MQLLAELLVQLPEQLQAKVGLTQQHPARHPDKTEPALSLAEVESAHV